MSVKEEFEGCARPNGGRLYTDEYENPYFRTKPTSYTDVWNAFGEVLSEVDQDRYEGILFILKCLLEADSAVEVKESTISSIENGVEANLVLRATKPQEQSEPECTENSIEQKGSVGDYTKLPEQSFKKDLREKILEDIDGLIRSECNKYYASLVNHQDAFERKMQKEIRKFVEHYQYIHNPLLREMNSKIDAVMVLLIKMREWQEGNKDVTFEVGVPTVQNATLKCVQEAFRQLEMECRKLKE